MFGALGDLVPNPMDLVPGDLVPGNQAPEETTDFSEEVVAAMASVELGMDQLTFFDDGPDVISTEQPPDTSDDKIQEIEAKLLEKAEIEVNEAVIFILQKLPTLDQAVLSVEATKKLIVANYELYGPLRLKAFNDAINSMHAGTQERCRSLDVLTYLCDKLFWLVTNALFELSDAVKGWEVPTEELRAITKTLITNFKLVATEAGKLDLVEPSANPDFDPEASPEFYQLIEHHSLPESITEDVRVQITEMGVKYMEAQDSMLQKAQQAYIFSRLKKAELVTGPASLIRRVHLHRLEDQIKQSNARAATMEQKHNEMKNKMEVAESENQRLQMEVDCWYNEVKELKPALVALQTEEEFRKKEFQFKTEFYESRIVTLRDKNSALQEQVDALSASAEARETKGDAQVKDFELELEGSIMESDSLHAQIDVLQQQVHEYTAKLEENISKMSDSMSENERQKLEVERLSTTLDKVEMSLTAAVTNYNQAKRESRYFRRGLEEYKQEVRNLCRQIALLQGELVVSASKLTDTEQQGLELFKTIKPETLQQCHKTSKVVSDLWHFAVAHRNKVDAEWEEAKKHASNADQHRSETEAQNAQLTEAIDTLKIELAQAKHGRNQFLLLARKLQSELETEKAESKERSRSLMQDMKFYSTQYDALKLLEPSRSTDDGAKNDQLIHEVTNKVADLEQASHIWAGLGQELNDVMTHYGAVDASSKSQDVA